MLLSQLLLGIASQPVLPRSITFSDGPRIEFSINDLSSETHHAAEQTEQEPREENSGDIQDEVAESAEAKDNAILDNKDSSREALSEARQAVDSQPALNPVWKRVLEGIKSFRDITDVIAEVCLHFIPSSTIS
jgi:hypothetical protein